MLRFSGVQRLAVIRGTTMYRRLAIIALVAVTCVAPQAGGQQGSDPLVAATDDPVLLQQYAIEYYRRDQLQQALGALTKSLSMYPDNSETHMWLGAVYMKLQDDDAALLSLQRALQLNPALTDAHNWLGVYWSERGDFEAAERHYRAALADPAFPRISRARVQFNLARILMGVGNNEGAIPLLFDAMRGPVPSNDPVFPWIRLQLAEALLLTGRPREVLSVLDELDVLPDTAERALLTGLAYRDLGQTGEAQDYLQSVLRMAPGSPSAERALEVLRELDSNGRR